jgi:hypothetical protein
MNEASQEIEAERELHQRIRIASLRLTDYTQVATECCPIAYVVSTF